MTGLEKEGCELASSEDALGLALLLSVDNVSCPLLVWSEHIRAVLYILMI
jgi:hypothetical protein